MTLFDLPTPEQPVTRKVRVREHERTVRATEPVASNPDANTPGLVAKNSKRGQKAGALAAEPKSGTRRRAVLDAIRAAGDDGATDDEIAAATGLDYSNLGPRRRELVAGGWVVDTGTTRASKAGVQVAVYRCAR